MTVDSAVRAQQGYLLRKPNGDVWQTDQWQAGMGIVDFTNPVGIVTRALLDHDHRAVGLSESSGFVCITGDVGTGKTTLLRAFLADLGPEVATAYIFNPALSALELLQTINSELGLPSDSTSPRELIAALNEHLLAQRRAGHLSVVIVDVLVAIVVMASCSSSRSAARSASPTS